MSLLTRLALTLPKNVIQHRRNMTYYPGGVDNKMMDWMCGGTAIGAIGSTFCCKSPEYYLIGTLSGCYIGFMGSIAPPLILPAVAIAYTPIMIYNLSRSLQQPHNRKYNCDIKPVDVEEQKRINKQIGKLP
jgi:hypothetical protein